MRLRVLAVRRARCYSPGHEAHDWQVLRETAERLACEGHQLRFTTEEEITEERPAADVLLNMCQGPLANGRLRAHEGDGMLLVNRPSAALDCLRYRLLPRLGAADVPIPESIEVATSSRRVPVPLRGRGRLWIKRADVHATGPDDVVCAEDESQANAALAEFSARGLDRAIVQQHLVGAVVKFYCVGREVLHHRITSGPQETWLDLPLLRRRALDCGEALGLDVYGGECVVTADGSLPVIDVNDWPSFAPCRERAARAIARLVLDQAALRR